MTEPLLIATNVSKKYDSGTTVLQDVNLSINKGDFISILGQSGSGKTTLLSILGGMDKASSGSVIFDGKDLSLLKEKELCSLRRTQIGFVFQFFNLAPYLTVKENILLPIMLNKESLKNYTEKYNELCSYLNIKHLESKMPRYLSGGEQQRIAIARGLIYSPKIIFLDEPTGNLDSKNSDEIMHLLSKINKELHTTVLQVTHNENNTKFGNRVLSIIDGKVSED